MPATMRGELDVSAIIECARHDARRCTRRPSSAVIRPEGATGFTVEEHERISLELLTADRGTLAFYSKEKKEQDHVEKLEAPIL